jgi:subtilisin family serine protease
VAVVSLAFASVVLADENPKNQPGQREGRIARYVLTPAHSLTVDEQNALRSLGVTFEHALTGGRYLVRMTADASSEVESAPTVTRLVPFTAEQKIYRSAYAAAAQTPGSLVRLTVRFHDGVSFDDARAAVEAAGGQLNSPFVLRFTDLSLLTVRVPASSLTALARDERVLLIEALPRKITGENAIAATVSNVTPLFSAPYGLSGNGVAMSIWELGGAGGGGGPQPLFNHAEFGSRYVSHYPVSGPSTDSHGTHTAGTIIAQGLNAAAKGMAPAATLNAFDATEDTDVMLADKANVVPPTGSVSDNNSWGYCIGWQPVGSSCGTGSYPTWFTCAECLGGYDGGFVAPYDKLARTSTTLYVHSAGNDATSGTPGLDTANFSPHYHLDPNTGGTLESETFCFSKDDSGNDCPAPLCTPGNSTVTKEPHCEKLADQHKQYGPFFTLGLGASGKNIVAVGAVDQSQTIAVFSSRGPAQDGRVKPDLVAKGVRQYSTTPGGTGCTTNPTSPTSICYGFKDGTSMASPVVTGIAGLLSEQWRKTFGKSPTPQQLKTIMIAGADDLGNAGPDYTYGFGLADAKASADLIIADGNQGNRIRGGTLSQKQTLTFPLTVPGGLSKLRVVLGWADPEVVGLASDELADGKTLVNDLDVKVVAPNTTTTLPYVLDKANPTAVATRGVNSLDNTEEVELATPAAGTYQVVVTANAIGDAVKPTQDFVLVANATLGAAAAPCTDAYEPNDTTAAAYGDVVTGSTLSAKICSAADVDFFRFFPDLAGNVKVHVTATDTPLTVTEFNAAGVATSNTINISAGQSADLSFNITGARREYIRFAANGPVGSTGSYTATFTYPFVTPARRHAAGH